MAWGTKYSLTFKDLGDATCTASFQYDGYSGAVTTLTPGDTPMKIRYNCNGKYDPIIGTEVEFQVVYQSDLEDLYVEEDQTVRVYVNGPLTNDWYGWLTPFQARREMGSIPHYATFIAVDGLGLLKNIKFRDSSDDPYFYISDDLTALYNILQETQAFPFTLKENLNIYADGFDETAADTPLDQTYWYPEMYWNSATDESSDCYTVLYDMVKKYGARLFQRDYQWHLRRPNAYWASNALRDYNDSGSAYTYSTNAVGYLTWNVSDNSGEWRARPQIYRKQRYGSVSITSTPPVRQNLSKNGTFETFTQSGGLPRYWDQSDTVGAGGPGNPHFSLSDGYFTINDKDATGDPDQYLYTDFRWNYVSNFTISIEFKATYSGGSNCVLHFGISNVAESLWWNPSTDTWQSTEVHYEYNVDDEIGSSMLSTSILTINVTSPLDNGGGSFRFSVFEVEDNNDTTAALEIHDVRIEPSHTELFPDTELVEEDNTATSYNTLSEELVQCDAFNINGGYDDQYFTLKGSTTINDLTDDWTIVGEKDVSANTGTIQEMLAKQYLRGNYYPREQIRGTLRGYYDYSEAIVDDNLTDTYGYPKVWVPLDQTYDFRRMEWTGTWEEVGPVYNDEDKDWDSHDYSSALITDNSIAIATPAVSGTDTATSESYTAVDGEMIRIVATCTDNGSSDLPNYAFDGNTGELEWGTNYLEFRVGSGGAKTFQINHTDGEAAICTVAFTLYSLTGL